MKDLARSERNKKAWQAKIERNALKPNGTIVRNSNKRINCMGIITPIMGKVSYNLTFFNSQF